MNGTREVDLQASTDVDAAYDEGYAQGYFDGRRAGVYEALDEVRDHAIRAMNRD